MSLQIAHNTETGVITLRWRFYAPPPDPHRDVLIGFVGDRSALRTAHPAIDQLDGNRWGPGLQQQVIDAMKAFIAKEGAPK